MSKQFIAHVEIPVKNLDKSAEFYLRLFHWELKPFGNGYYLYDTKKGVSVGLRRVDKVNKGDSTIFHVNVPDIDMVLDLVKLIGGKVERDKTVIPVFGWYALIKDIDGNTIGLYQSRD